MSFKDMLESDVSRVFQNENEFAELVDLIYDGKEFRQVPIVLIRDSEHERKVLANDHGMGVYEATATCYIAFSKIGVLPEQGQMFTINDEDYRIVESSCRMGQIVLKLRRFDE